MHDFMTGSEGVLAPAEFCAQRRLSYAVVMSLHPFQTCAVSSQSHRKERTYSPGAMFVGTLTWSTIFTVVGQLPAHGPGFVP